MDPASREVPRKDNFRKVSFREGVEQFFETELYSHQVSRSRSSRSKGTRSDLSPAQSFRPVSLPPGNTKQRGRK
jgi:hypothetical protein